jgi:hypothetical protein
MNFSNGLLPIGSTEANQTVKNARDAMNVNKAFGIPLAQNAGVMANILPAAIQIEEHKKMTEVARQYQEKYVNDFKTKYGFKSGDLESLREDFDTITKQVTDLIPEGDMRNIYKKYVESYPHMYLSMIPAEALQSKLAVKCVTENRVLRAEIEKMSACVSTLVQGLSKLQMAAGVPPIVNLMFESMPDPLTSITDPMYHSYNEAIQTYHKLLAVEVGEGDKDIRADPVGAIQAFIASKPSIEGVTDESLSALLTVIQNMGTQSGCTPYGDEWNHDGPEPAMNPAMCMGEESMQAGNPRHHQGRSAVYQAQRTQDGGAQWVLKGQVPNVAGGAPQFVQPGHPGQMFHQQQPAYGSDPWAGFAPAGHQMPVRKASKKAPKKSSKKSSKKASK